VDAAGSGSCPAAEFDISHPENSESHGVLHGNCLF
jgi:hypothetical protein